MEVAKRTEPWKAGCAEDGVCRLIGPVVQIYIFSFRLNDVESVFPKKNLRIFEKIMKYSIISCIM